MTSELSASQPDQKAQAIFHGTLAETGGMSGVLDKLSDVTDVQMGILRIVSKQASGRVGVFCGRYLTGAVIAASEETGMEALKTLLSTNDGAYSFTRASAETFSELQQSLGIDILATETADLLDDNSLRADSDRETESLSPAGFFISDSNSHIESLADSRSTLTSIPINPKDQGSPINQVKGFLVQAGLDLSKSKLGQLLTTFGGPAPKKANSNPNTGTNTNSNTNQNPGLSTSLSQSPDPRSTGTNFVIVKNKPAEPSSWALPDDYQPVSDLSIPAGLALPPAPSAPPATPAPPRPALPQRVQSDSALVPADTSQPKRGDFIIVDQNASANAAVNAQSSSSSWAVVEVPNSTNGSNYPGDPGRPMLPTPTNQYEVFQNAEAEWDLMPIPTARSTGTWDKQTVQNAIESRELMDKLAADKLIDSKKFLASGANAKDDDPEALNRRMRRARITAIGIGVLFLAMILGNIGVGIWTSFSVGENLQRAKAALHAGNYEQCVIELEKNSPNAEVAYYEGLAYLLSNQYDNALDQFKKAEKLNPNLPGLLTAEARTYLGMGRNHEAADIASEAINKNKAIAATYIIDAAANAGQADYDKAVEDCDEGLKIAKANDEKAALYAARASALYEQQNYEKAVKDYDSAIAVVPNEARLHLGKGLCLMKLHDYKGASASFDKAIAADPTQYETYFHRGICLKSEAKYAAAANDFSKCINHQIYTVNAYRERALCYLKTRKYNDAISDYDQAIQLNPRLPGVTLERQIAYDNIHAAKKLQIVSDVQHTSTSTALPESVDALTKLGYSKLRDGDTDTAIAALTKALSKSPGNTTARRYLAHALLANGDDAQSMQQFSALSRIGALQPSDTTAYAKSLIATKNTQAAVSLLRDYLRRNPNDPEAVRLLTQAEPDQ